MSDDNRYHVRLTGELMGGADAARVAANLARLFKMPEEKAALLVSGKPRVVKKDADEATARKFQVALRQAGARCELLPVNGEATPAAPAAEPERAEPARQEAVASAVPAPAAGELEGRAGVKANRLGAGHPEELRAGVEHGGNRPGREIQ